MALDNRPMNLDRVPVMPISYDQKDRAVARELVANYETGNLYIKNEAGDLINVFQAALKVDNQWSLSSAKLNKARAFHGLCGSQVDAITFNGEDDNGNSIEIFDGVSWAVQSATTSITGYNTAACGTSNNALVASYGDSTSFFYVEKYTNGTMSTVSVISSSTRIPSGSVTIGCDLLGTSELANILIYDGIYQINSSSGTMNILNNTAFSANAEISQVMFGSLQSSIITGSFGSASNTVTYRFNGSTLTSLSNMNTVRRGSFGASGTTSVSGMAFGGVKDYAISSNMITNADTYITDVSEEWVNGTTWKSGGNIGFAARGIAGCGASEYGLGVGGYISDGTKSTYTTRYATVDSLTYLKSLKDDIDGIINDLSAKIIDSAFDCFVTIADILPGTGGAATNAAIAANKNNAVIVLNRKFYRYNKTSKSYTMYDNAIFGTTYAYNDVMGYTDGTDDSNVVFLSDGSYGYQTTYRRGVVITSTNAYAARTVTASWTGTIAYSTSKLSGIYCIDSGTTIIKYSFTPTTSSLSATLSTGCTATLARKWAYCGGDQSIAYITGGVAQSSGVIPTTSYLNTEKVVNGTTISQVADCLINETVSSVQSGLLVYGNDYIKVGNAGAERFDRTSETWSIKDYGLNNSAMKLSTNGNTSDLGLAISTPTVVSNTSSSPYTANWYIEEFRHGNVLDIMNGLLNRQDGNINIENAEYINVETDYAVRDIDTSRNSSSTISGTPYIPIVYDDGSYSYWSLYDVFSSGLYHEDPSFSTTGDYAYYDLGFSNGAYFKHILDENWTSDRIRAFDGLILYILFGDNPATTKSDLAIDDVSKEIGGSVSLIYSYLSGLNQDIVNGTLDFTMSGLLRLAKNHNSDGSHPEASADNAGYLSKSHYTLLANASASYDSTSTLMKRGSNGYCAIKTLSQIGSAAYDTSYYNIANISHVYTYYIRNSTASNDYAYNTIAYTQTISTKLKVAGHSNYTIPYVRNIVYWTSGDAPTSSDGDLIIKTF